MEKLSNTFKIRYRRIADIPQTGMIYAIGI